MAKHLDVELSNHIATVSLSSPTMPPRFFEELGEIFGDLGARDELRCIVIRGSDKAFSYGLDLPRAFQEHGPILMGANLAGPRMKLRDLILRWQSHITSVAACPVPVIAAIHGWCIGGGLDLASACDVRLASADARLSLRETRIAIVADLGSLQRVPRLIGHGMARELALTGRDVSAEEACSMGLVNRVYPDRGALWEGAQAMAEEIAANPPLTVRGVKQVLDYSSEHSVADGLQYVAAWNSAFLASEDLGEAIAAFSNRRRPDFKGQ
jgi:enoyl-CoA hydratase